MDRLLLRAYVTHKSNKNRAGWIQYKEMGDSHFKAMFEASGAEYDSRIKQDPAQSSQKQPVPTVSLDQHQSECGLLSFTVGVGCSFDTCCHDYSTICDGASHCSSDVSSLCLHPMTVTPSPLVLSCGARGVWASPRLRSTIPQPAAVNLGVKC
ncbi:unnamed protein product [Pleuronectes platessa]|uniref:Uncharacterized protein n=1 Tax=Pleuronectes platessa TaxID=8262 RepID=A0A9N7TRX2_PLEPL|nr:unnamed protein product [Pleuronectes platessa]